MRVFNQLVFDGYVSGTTNVYSDEQHDALLGSVDKLCIAGYTAQVTGTIPTLTVQVEHSYDHIRWVTRNATAEINGLTLSTTGEWSVQGQDGDPATRATLGFARLRIAMGGTSPKGQVRLWVSGRDSKS